MLATLAIAILCGVSAPSAQAGYIVTLQEVGPNVVATGTGAFDLTGLALEFTNDPSAGAQISPSTAQMVMGSTSVDVPVDDYQGLVGPLNFGVGPRTNATSGSGDHVILDRLFNDLSVPTGYVSGNPLFSISTYDGATLSSLGVTPGTYVWAWGTGANQNFTLIAAVPDLGSTFGLLFVSLVALVGAHRFRGRQLA